MGFDWCIKLFFPDPFLLVSFFLSLSRELILILLTAFFLLLILIVASFFCVIDALRIVKDRKYGAKNADEVGGW